MREISKVERKLPKLPPKKKVAAYARVSTETNRTFHSFSAQVCHYSEHIQKNTAWIFAGIYADQAISGTNQNRPEFQRMLADCEAGKIDMILTKSISRFARNTVDLLNTVRHLRALGIEVRFEKENIYSLSEDGELMLTLLASFAQEESRSTSENVKWAIQKKFQVGRPNSYSMYGYRWNGLQFIVEPEEAKIVKLIYDNFLNGLSAGQTESQLADMGVKSYMGQHFSRGSVRNILRNEKYTGNMLMQKQFITDHITHHCKDNEGELPQYWVADSHEAIIPLETFNQVQDEIARRRALGVFANPAINTGCFTSKIKCGYCDRSFHRSTRVRNNGKPYTIWTCASRKKGGGCKNKDVPETILESVCADVLGLDTFDEAVFSQTIEQILAPEPNELIFVFYDGRQVQKRWEPRPQSEWWSPETRAAMSAYVKKHPFGTGTITCFTSHVTCAVCGQNLRRYTATRKSGKKASHWRCPSPKTCDHHGLEETQLESISADVLGLTEFNPKAFTDRVESVIVASDTELLFHLKDGSEVSRGKHGRPRP